METTTHILNWWFIYKIKYNESNLNNTYIIGPVNGLIFDMKTVWPAIVFSEEVIMALKGSIEEKVHKRSIITR